MNNYLKIILLSFLGLLVWSCGDDYLETNPTGFLNENSLNEIAEFDPSIFDGVLAGVYVTMNNSGTGLRGFNIHFNMRSLKCES